MHITDQFINGVLVVGIHGRLDGTNANQVETYLSKAIDDGHTKLVLELSELEYISSIGLRVFLAMGKKVSKTGYIRLAALQPQVFDVFHMSGFDTIFQIFNNAEDAVV